jgi:ATP-binding cassette subfamily B protein
MKNNKPTHSIISNVKYFFGLQWSYSKLSVVFLILLIPINISISFINIYLPKLVVSEIINQRPFEHIVFSLLTIGIILILLNISNKAISSSNSALMLKFRYGLLNRKVSKAFKTDYENIEAPQFRYLMSRADESLWGSGKGSIVERMTSGITELITNILGYILFGSILSVINPWIAVVLTLFSLIHYFSLRRVRKFQHANREEISKLDYKLWYIASNSSSFEGAADVRIYGMNRWFINMFKTLTKERLGWDRKILWRTYITHIIDALIIILRDGFAYAILITKVLNGDLSIDNFIFHFAAVGSFARLVGGILEKYNDIYSVSLTSCDLRDYLEYPEKENRGEGVQPPSLSVPYEIELRDVSYRYQGAEEDTLRRLSLKIRKGEKVAIVGLNGAGKTTLVKIICGLYNPTQGKVLINGIEKQRFNIYDYYSLFSTVFQDYHFLPVSIACTVSGKSKEQTDTERVKKCLEAAGLWEKVSKLEKGMDSMLNKQLNADGIELSGGEMQKLILARAIYKDAPILILDEPTAALDPIAESNLYQTYNELSKNKTSIFISHRLASTRFCDRIIFMENGEFVETGTHDELMKKDGKYAELFKIQSRYYK